ncbi:MAG: hypothetical protein WD599_01830 [Balneolaceae bacterium]
MTVFGILFFFTLSGCGNQDDQREFEREAYQPPENFTETQNGSEVKNRDPDDWRIAPFFEGSVEVTPAWPNPVQSTDAVHLQLYFGIESVRVLRLFAYHHGQQLSLNEILEEDLGMHSSALIDLQFNAAELIPFDNPESRAGLYRVILLDGNQNVITYGDIKVN